MCTGNVFRSVGAEYCFKKYLADNHIEGWKVGSAGIFADPASVDPEVVKALEKFGIDPTPHVQRRLFRKMLGEYVVVVGMAENHIDFMKAEFHYAHALLFNELALGERTSIWDVENEVADYQHNRPAVENKIDRTIAQIHEGIPNVYKNVLKRFYA